MQQLPFSNVQWKLVINNKDCKIDIFLENEISRKEILQLLVNLV